MRLFIENSSKLYSVYFPKDLKYDLRPLTVKISNQKYMKIINYLAERFKRGET